jgi:hypothetical protein
MVILIHTAKHVATNPMENSRQTFHVKSKYTLFYAITVSVVRLRCLADNSQFSK